MRKDSRKDLRGTWPQALGSLLFSILFILTIRWALFEPYVIPSGSMIPTLLIHDHILVNKFTYGLRVPFTNDYLIRWSSPKRGDVLVFRSVEAADTFLVKRLVGLPGDKIQLDPEGHLSINSQKLEWRKFDNAEIETLFKSWPELDKTQTLAAYDVFSEKLDSHAHPVMKTHPKSKIDSLDETREFDVPKDQFFMMGDNRDNSADSRYWGFLPFAQILGRASVIWLSCEQLLPNSQICDPATLRRSRIFTSIL